MIQQAECENCLRCFTSNSWAFKGAEERNYMVRIERDGNKPRVNFVQFN